MNAPSASGQTAIVIEPEGDVYEIAIPDSVPDQLAALQAAVGGPIEALANETGTGLSCFCNEEGKLLGLAPNPVGQAVAVGLGASIALADILVGPVVITGEDGRGDATGLTPAARRTITALAEEIRAATFRSYPYEAAYDPESRRSKEDERRIADGRALGFIQPDDPALGGSQNG